jgi:hypothetical protein
MFSNYTVYLCSEKELERKTKNWKDVDASTTGADALVAAHPTEPISVVWFKPGLTLDELTAIIPHESVHVVCNLCKKIGANDEELTAYLVGYVAEFVFKNLK